MTTDTSDSARTEFNSAPAYRVWPIAVGIFVVAFASLARNLTGKYVADARFELYWGTQHYLARHLELWDSARNLGRPSPYFSPVIGLFVGLCRAVGMSPAWAERTLHAAMMTVGAAGAAAVYRHYTTGVHQRDAKRFRNLPGHETNRIPVGAWATAFIFAFAPYVSEFLVPSGLFWHYALAPWILLSFAVGTETRAMWRSAAIFALCIFAMGAVNPASLIYSLFPIVPIAIATCTVFRTTSVRKVLRWTVRAITLSGLCAAAALVSVTSNMPVLAANLATTELPKTVSAFSSWGESWRGLGSWLTYFLGGGATSSNASPFLTNRLAIAASWIVPLISVVVLWRNKHRARFLFGSMMAVTIVVMVGLFPTTNSSPLGRILNTIYESAPTTRSLRNVYKAGAGLVLAQAALVGLGIDQFRDWTESRLRSRSDRTTPRTPRIRSGTTFAGLATAAIVIATAVPFWTAEIYSPKETVSSIPEYWKDAFRFINHLPDTGRVLILPGTNRTRYKWGYVGDDMFDAFLTQPHASRSSLPQGTPEAADLLVTLDRYASAPAYEPGVLSTIATRLGFQWIVLRNDLDWSRISAPPPAAFAAIRKDPTLSLVASFGSANDNVSASSSAHAGPVPPVEIFRIAGAPGLNTASAAPPLLVSGSGESWTSMAEVGLLDHFGPIGYLNTRSPAGVQKILDRGGAVVVTEGNRRRVRRVTAERNFESQTLASSDFGQDRPPVALFEGTENESVADFGVGSNISASAYGSPGESFPTSFRPANAFDGNPRTAWVVGGQQPYKGHWIRIRFDEPTEISNIIVRQRRRPDNDPTIKKLNVRFESAGIAENSSGDANATVSSTTFNLSPGQTVLNSKRGTYTALEFRIDGVLASSPSGVGISDIDLIGADNKRLRTEETIVTSANNATIGSADPNLTRSIADRTMFLFTRSRLNAPLDEETDVRRQFETSSAGALSAKATIEITPTTPDIVLDTLRNENIGAYGSSRFQGSIESSTGFNVLDGRPLTAWRFIPNPNESLSIRLAAASSPNSIVVRTPTAANRSVSTISSVSVAGYRTVVDEFGKRSEILVFGGAGSERVPIQQTCDAANDKALCLSNTEIALPGEQVDRLQIDVRDIETKASGIGRFPAVINDIAIDGDFGLEAAGTRRQPGECVDLIKLDGEPVGFDLTSSETLFTENVSTGKSLVVESCAPQRTTKGTHLLEGTISAESVLRNVLLLPSDFEFPRVADPRDAQVQSTVGGELVGQRVTARGPAIFTNGQAYGPGWFASVGTNTSVRAESWNTLNGWAVPKGTTIVATSYQPQRWYLAAMALTVFGVALALSLAVPRLRRPIHRRGTTGARLEPSKRRTNRALGIGSTKRSKNSKAP